MTLLKRIKELERVMVYEESEPIFIAVSPACGYEKPWEPIGVHLTWDKSLRLERLPDEPIEAFIERTKRELIAPNCGKLKPAILFFDYIQLPLDDLAQYGTTVTIGQPRERQA